ncbi:MAG: SMC family ATPase [Actinobacteria bacterium]|nr:SMC family ATPase [Actinomycetota bacterium]
MRPRRLEMEAIGPFGGSVEVDFDELAADGLFLIHGPTGAGKSSLLDGICLALYGRVPGARGKARSDRSHFAAWGVAPRAVLDFDAQDGSYRVERTAAWEAPKARGTGTTPKPATAVLRRLDPGHEAIVAAKPTEVDAEVERLLGLTAAQFQQVILLPQGKFERVLQANSREREELFETLFDTVDFKQATAWLEHEAKRHRTTVAGLRQRLGVLGEEAVRRSRDVLVDVDLAGAPAVTTAGPGGLAVLDRPAGTPSPTIPVEGDPLDPATIDRLVVALVEAVESARVRVEDVEARERLGRAAVEDARRVAHLVVRRDALRAQAATLAAADPDVELARSRLAEAEAAELLRASLDELDHRTNVVRRADHAVAADLGNARAARDALVVPVAELEGLDLERVPSARAIASVGATLAVRHEVLTGLRATASRVAEAETELASADRKIAGHLTTVDAVSARLATFRAELPGKVAEVASARSAAERLADLELAASTAATRAAAAHELAELVPEVERAARAAEQGRTDANDAREAHLLALEQYLEGMAAHLAGRLELDEACLVCGSHEHPNPAQPAEGAVSEDDVEELRLRSEAAEAARADLAEAHRRRSNEAAALRATADHVADDPVEARRLAREAKAAFAKASELAGRLDATERLVAEIEAALGADAERLAGAETALAEERAGRAALDRRLGEARAVLAEHLPAGVDLDEAVASVDRARVAIGRVADHAADGQEAAAKLQAARERAEAELGGSRFDEVDAVRAAMLDADDRRSLAERLREHERRTTEVAAQLASADLVDLPADPPDMEALEAELRQLEARRRTAAQRHVLASSAHLAVVELAGTHRGVAADLAEAEETAALHERVADRCSGRTAPRVPLQRWVLATYLEEVCAHANRRLATMTSGRYRLLVTRTPAKANQPAGLDLRVHDANTNQEREVTTLSGGETFQASLALALGVADSVEAHTGGVRLDALFVDEGFGTLDPDALELALDELDGLRAGGRMVGVISHVQRLRERIRLGAEVHKGEDGSTVTVGDVPPL